MIKQVKFVSIPVTDQNRALDFYTDKLGFTIITELTKRGVEFDGPPRKESWGTFAIFKDSEGNRFVVSGD